MTYGGREAPLERRPNWAALAIALFLLALAAIVAWDAAHMRAGVAAYSRISPRAFPYGIAIGLALVAIATGWLALRQPAQPGEPDEIAPMAWIVGGLLAQMILLPFAGFSIATGAVFAGTAAGFGRKRLWLTYPIGVAFALFVWLFFSQALSLVLPAGVLEEGASDILRRAWTEMLTRF